MLIVMMYDHQQKAVPARKKKNNVRPEENDCWITMQENNRLLKHEASTALWATAGDCIMAHTVLVHQQTVS